MLEGARGTILLPRGSLRENFDSLREPEGTLLPDHRATDRYWSICLFRHLVNCNYLREVVTRNTKLEMGATHLDINLPSHLALTIQELHGPPRHFLFILYIIMYVYQCLDCCHWEVGMFIVLKPLPLALGRPYIKPLSTQT